MWTIIAIFVGLLLAAVLFEGIWLACFDYLTHGSISKPPDADEAILTSTGKWVVFLLASIPTVWMPIGLGIHFVAKLSHSPDSVKASLDSVRFWMAGGFFLSSLGFLVMSLLLSVSENLRRIILQTPEKRGQFRVTSIVIFYSIIGAIVYLLW